MILTRATATPASRSWTSASLRVNVSTEGITTGPAGRVAGVTEVRDEECERTSTTAATIAAITTMAVTTNGAARRRRG